MERIKKWFLHNPLLKLVSLVIAFLIWLIVVNTSNPKVTDTIAVTYDILNEKAIESSNQVYFTNTSTVSITYSVRTKYRTQVTADAFSAYINLEDYSITGAVPVYLEIDAEVSDLISDVTVNPSVIHVSTESIQQKEFSIEKQMIGTPAEGYKAGELSVYPESIYVKGPVSVIGKISSVGVEVDVEGATSDLEGITTVAFYDANGNELSGIEENLSFAGDVSYSIPIYRIKSLTVNAFTGGAPATGYTVDSVETSPTFISVYGPEEILNQYSYIVIPGSDLNITGMSENITFNLETSRYIPDGLKLATQTPEITVYVKFRNIFEQPVETTEAEVIDTTETYQETLHHQTTAATHESMAESTSKEETSSTGESLESSAEETTNASSGAEETKETESEEMESSTEESSPQGE